MAPTDDPAADDRYSRQRLIDGWNQKRLSRARILVAGAGAIGNEVIKLLALIGVGEIHIVDFDRVELSNLTRSVLFRNSDVGRRKAVVAAERAVEINPDIRTMAYDADLEYEIGLGMIRSMDMTIGCLDSIQSRLVLNRACLRAAVPWLNGAIEVSTAEISLYSPESGSCFECAMSDEMWRRREERYSCTGLKAAEVDAPVPTTAIDASLCAAYLVQEAMYLLHQTAGTAKPGLQPGEKIAIQMRPYHTAVYLAPIRLGCSAHEAIGPIEMTEIPSASTSLTRFLHLTGLPDGILELGFDLLTEMSCSICGAAESIMKPAERCPVTLEQCPKGCGRTRYAETVSWFDSNHPISELPLRTVGIPPHGVITIKIGSDRRYFQLDGPA